MKTSITGAELKKITEGMTDDEVLEIHNQDTGSAMEILGVSILFSSDIVPRYALKVKG